MKRRTLLIWALALLAQPAMAHHSASMFDRTKPRALKGVVRDFQWTNPHCTLKFVGATGTPEAGELWVVELTSPGSLTRLGWTKRALNPGDNIDIVVGPMRTGGAAGLMMQVKNLTTGNEFAQPGPTYQR